MLNHPRQNPIATRQNRKTTSRLRNGRMLGSFLCSFEREHTGKRTAPEQHLPVVLSLAGGEADHPEGRRFGLGDRQQKPFTPETKVFSRWDSEPGTILNRVAAGQRYHEPIELATLLNVLLAFVPTELIAAKHTTTIKASMTAYSTAVGPSSETRNRRIC
jgi:hypothetical protein